VETGVTWPVHTYVEGEADPPMTPSMVRAWWIAGTAIVLLFGLLALLILVD
jgi:hypothetical protein